MSEAEPPRPSLAAQLPAMLRNRIAGLLAGIAARREMPTRGEQVEAVQRSAPRDWWIAALVAALIALGSVATIVSAWSIAGKLRSDSRLLTERAVPRMAAERTAAEDRAALAAVLRRPAIGAVIEAVARALPPEASLASASRDKDGLLTLEIATPDPDRLRAALRREPMLAGLRDSGQRQAGAMMLVALREAAE